MRQARWRRPYFSGRYSLMGWQEMQLSRSKMQPSHFRPAGLGPIILSAGPHGPFIVQLVGHNRWHEGIAPVVEVA
jgi:hypothetical protein